MPKRLIAVLGSLVLLVTACSSAALTDAQRLAVERAAETLPALRLTSSFTTTELLDTESGEATSLEAIVTGDRAVLLWFWAPT